MHWHQFDQRRDILVWTISIAHNAYMDDRRRNARSTVVTPHESQPDALHDVADAGSADVGLRIPIGTLMSRISRGRVALRALLDGGTGVPVPAVHTLRRVV